jgi:hypothetical protein
MDWLYPYLQDEKIGFIALAVGGGALGLAVLFALLSVWFNWRAARLRKLAKRFQGRQKLAEEVLSSMAAEEKDLRRLMGEMEKAQAKG